MSYQDCIAEIRTAAGGKLSDDEVEQILDTVLRRAKRASPLGALNSEGLRLAAESLAEEARKTSALERRNALINMRNRIGRRQRITAAGDPVLGFKAEIHGVNTPIEGGRFSAQAEWKARSRAYVAGMTRDLQRAGLFQSVRAGALEREWTRELFELSKGDAGNPGVSGSAEALTIARIVHKYQNAAKRAANRAGAAIGDYSGYITRTSHDMDKIRRAGADPWKQVIKPLLADETFDYVGGPGTKEADDFLNNVWHALVTGVHLTHEGMQGFKDPAFTGPGNLAKRLSQDRVLHFRDANSWLDYHQQFGRGTVAENVINNLDSSARATALMNHFGTNPRAEFDADLRWLKENLRNRDPETVLRLQNAEPGLRNRFDFLDGTANMPVNRLWAKIGSTARVVESMAKLGLVAFTHLSFGATKAAELRYQGANLFERYGNFITSLKPGRNDVADELLAGLEGAHRDLLSRFQIDDGVPGTLSKLANTFFHWSGLTYLFEHQRQGGEELMARMLGRQFDRSFDQLEPESARLLRLFGIGDREWELLRQAPEHAEIDGRQFLTPYATTRIPEAQVIQHLFDTGQIDKRIIPPGPVEARKIDAWRRDLAIRLYAMFNDRSEYMVVTPDIQTRAAWLGNTRAGTAQGEFWRFMAQFKTWPTALIQQAIGREWYGGQTRLAAAGGIIQMALAATVLGYGIMTLKDLVKGRNPRDPLSPKTWAAAIMQGGGAGILGDFLFGEYSRFGQPVTDTILGPVLGQGASTVIDMWNRLKAGAEDPTRKHDIAPELFRALLDNTPFVNILGLRTALNYLFLWQVQEALNPGSVRRMERTIQQQQHQTFWLSPSRAIGQ